MKVRKVQILLEVETDAPVKMLKEARWERVSYYGVNFTITEKPKVNVIQPVKGKR